MTRTGSPRRSSPPCASARGLAGDEHISVDGTLIESHASIKSFRPIDDERDNSDDNDQGPGRGARAGNRPRTLGADRGYDSGPWMVALESRGITPHAAMRRGRVGGAKNTSAQQHKNRPLIAARRRNQERMTSLAYTLSQRARKLSKDAFGWSETIGGMALERYVGRSNIRQQFELAAAEYNLVGMRKLLSG